MGEVEGGMIWENSMCAESLQSSLTPCKPMDCRLLYPWDSPGKNTRVACHFLLEGIFLAQRSNPCLLCLLHWQVGSSPLVSPGKPLKHIHYHMSNSWPVEDLCMMQGNQSPCSVTTWRDGVGREVGGGLRREGTRICLWPIHVDVWQKPSQYYKVIILQLK